MHITFTPTITEHLRATGELRRVARVYDAAAALPYFLACVVIGSVITQARAIPGPLTFQELFGLLMPLMFFVGLGIGVRNGIGKGIRVTVGTEGIEVAQPRRGWRVRWDDVRRVDETDEFFLVAATGAALYIPKRTMDDREAEWLRGVLEARGS